MATASVDAFEHTSRLREWLSSVARGASPDAAGAVAWAGVQAQPLFSELPLIFEK